MEIEKVVRIVASCIAVLAFAIWLALVFCFPEHRKTAYIPQVIILGFFFWHMWDNRKQKQSKNTDNQ